MSVNVGTIFTPIVKLNSGQFLNPINVNGIQRYYVFSSSGTLSINVQCDAQVLLVGGGGGGGPWRGGGGGAGCVIAGQGQSLGCGVPLILRRNQQYTIIVGSGGTGSYGNDLYTDSQNGHPSIFSSSTNGILYAGGGGRGDRYPGNLVGIGGSGGGGCGSGAYPGGETGTFIINTSTGQNISLVTAKGYQNFGGGGGVNNYFNGGGGGAGSIGGTGSVNGNGGSGIMVFSDIDPFNCNSYYGGGGGGCNLYGGVGGWGGGGSCGVSWFSGEKGIDGTGGGGGGIYGNTSGVPQPYKAGDGGTGCCIIKIKNVRRR